MVRRVFVYNVSGRCKTIGSGDTKFGPGFNVTVVNSWKTPKTWDADYAIFMDAYYRCTSAERNKEGFSIIKDTTITSVPSHKIAALIDKVQVLRGELFYISDWMDRCDMMQNASPGIVSTQSPNGFQAITFWPSIIKRIMSDHHPKESPLEIGSTMGSYLNLLVTDDDVKAYTAYPPVAFFDIVNHRRNRWDSLKMSLCQNIPGVETPVSNRLSSDLTFFWLVLILYTVIMTCIVFIYMKNKGYI